jgi:hypothetical protein
MPTPHPGGSARAPFPPVTDFPPLIGQAIARAAGADGGGLGELDGEERALLVRIVRNVSVAAPAESVRISNLTLAAALRTGERTVRRLKSALEAKGWITRRQVQSRRRGMQILDIWLTPHALATLFGPEDADLDRRRSRKTDALLAFPQSSRQPCRASMSSPPQPDPAGLPADPKETRLDGSSAAQEPVQAPVQQAVDPLVDPPAKPPPAANNLPEDVRMLAEIGGVTVAGVRLLMGAATRAGTRLGDVLSAAGDAVLKARHPFGYTKTLIHCDKDWGAVAQEKRRQDHERRGVGQRLGELQRLVQAMGEGTMYSHDKHEFVWRAEFGQVSQSSVQDAAGGGIGRWLPMVDVSGLASAWREGRLFPVTTADVAAWLAPGAPIQANPSINKQPGAQSSAAGPSEAVKAALHALRTQLRHSPQT